MTCPKCNDTGEDWTNVSTTSGALNGEDCSCREPTPAEYAECRRALEECSGVRDDMHAAVLAAQDREATLQDALARERKRTRSGVRTPPPGHESQFYGAPQFLAACKERDEAERLASHYLAEGQRRHQALNCIHAFLADIETSSLSMVEVKEIIRQWCDEANGLTDDVPFGG